MHGTMNLKLSRKFSFNTYDKITGALHEDQCTFMISGLILLRMGNFDVHDIIFENDQQDPTV